MREDRPDYVVEDRLGFVEEQPRFHAVKDLRLEVRLRPLSEAPDPRERILYVRLARDEQPAGEPVPTQGVCGGGRELPPEVDDLVVERNLSLFRPSRHQV